MDRKETYFLASLLIILSALTVTSVKAERVEPTGRDTPVTATFDKSSPPSQIDIWKNESGGYDTDNPGLWVRNSWVCLSSSDPENGQCKTKPSWCSYYTESIPILFREKRSHLTQIINIGGSHTVGAYGTFKSDSGCSGGPTYETTANFKIAAAELAKFPTGGIWQAEFKVVLTQWDPEIKLADWNAHITLNVTDNNNQQIYLPEFGEAAAHVDLSMRPLPGTGGNQTQMNGAATIDMCLYDGYGSNSTSFTLKFDDLQQGTKERNNAYFSIYSDQGDVNQDSGRIDYYVRMQAPDGKYISVIRGNDLVIPDIQTAHIRPMHLPGIPQAVLCIPAPLELSTKTIDINSKQAGHYTGHLIVNFTPQL